MTACIAVINAGSSSIKFAIYEAGAPGPLLFRGQVQQIGASPKLKVVDAAGELVLEQDRLAGGNDHRAAANEILRIGVELIHGARVLAVGHRVVHGGVRYASPTLVDAEVLEFLATLSPLAPLHQPNNLAPIHAIAEAAPHIPQIACFDTAFHRDQPHIAQMFGLPRRFTDEGVRRYGFHGLSYEYVASQLPDLAPGLADGRVVIAHLGSGASLCALSQGRSVATSMGFTALDGLMMGTRTGAIDPGVLLYLMDAHGMDARQIEDLLYRRSGLLGVSGVSSDMRELWASAEPAAVEAIALFVYRTVREIGSLAAALGGLDAVVFTAGIGENDPAIRAEIAAGCNWLGLELDPTRNAGGGPGRISADGSQVSAWVVPTDEERMVARHAAQALSIA